GKAAKARKPCCACRVNRLSSRVAQTMRNLTIAARRCKVSTCYKRSYNILGFAHDHMRTATAFCPRLCAQNFRDSAGLLRGSEGRTALCNGSMPAATGALLHVPKTSQGCSVLGLIGSQIAGGSDWDLCRRLAGNGAGRTPRCRSLRFRLLSTTARSWSQARLLQTPRARVRATDAVRIQSPRESGAEVCSGSCQHVVPGNTNRELALDLSAHIA